jgi:hypothetical protein
MSPETDEQEIEQCEQFCFHFDQPHSNNHGNVLITQNNVKIVFPQTTTNKANNTLRPNINFFFIISKYSAMTGYLFTLT